MRFIIDWLEEEIVTSPDEVSAVLEGLADDARRVSRKVLAEVYDDDDEFSPVLIVGLGGVKSFCLLHDPRTGQWLESKGGSGSHKEVVEFESDAGHVSAPAIAMLDNDRVYRAASEFCRNHGLVKVVEWMQMPVESRQS